MHIIRTETLTKWAHIWPWKMNLLAKCYRNIWKLIVEKFCNFKCSMMWAWVLLFSTPHSPIYFKNSHLASVLVGKMKPLYTLLGKFFHWYFQLSQNKKNSISEKNVLPKVCGVLNNCVDVRTSQCLAFLFLCLYKLGPMLQRWRSSAIIISFRNCVID